MRPPKRSLGLQASVIKMDIRNEFEFTQEQVTEVYDCNFEPKMVIVGVNDTVQRRADLLWERFGREMGFDTSTVKRVMGKSVHFFTAKTIPMMKISTKEK